MAELRRSPGGLLPAFRPADPPDPARAPDPYFAELNRNRTPADHVGPVRYSMTPQVHATDDRSIFECLEGIADTVRTARSFLPPGAQLIAGPITLARRFTPDGDGWAVAPADPRERQPFGAAWAVGCIAELVRGGADVAELYDTGDPLVVDLLTRAGRPTGLLDAANPLAAGGLVCDGLAWVASYADRPQRVRLPDGTELALGPYAVVRRPLAGGGR